MRSYTVIIITFSIRTNMYVNNLYCIVFHIVIVILYSILCLSGMVLKKKFDIGNYCP